MVVGVYVSVSVADVSVLSAERWAVMYSLEVSHYVYEKVHQGAPRVVGNGPIFSLSTPLHGFGSGRCSWWLSWMSYISRLYWKWKRTSKTLDKYNLPCARMMTNVYKSKAAKHDISNLAGPGRNAICTYTVNTRNCNCNAVAVSFWYHPMPSVDTEWLTSPISVMPNRPT